MDALPPYYHPTTIAVLDDSYSFHEHLNDLLPDDVNHLSLLSPEEAIDVLNTPHRLPSLAERCLSVEENSLGGTRLRKDLHLLAREITEPDRFARVSVLLVDLTMPTMSGIEFCARLEDPHIMRGLMTEEGGEVAAVAAFNRDLIHRYIPKSRLQTPEDVAEHIRVLQRAYFDQFRAALLDDLASPPEFMRVPAVQRTFSNAVAQLDIIEYYLVGGPMGYLMLRTDGSMSRFIAMSAHELQVQVDYVRARNAPADVVARLSSGDAVGFFYEDPDDYLGHEPYPWEDMVVPATRVSNGEWFVATSENPPADIDFDPSVQSYASFLQRVRKTP